MTHLSPCQPYTIKPGTGGDHPAAPHRRPARTTRNGLLVASPELVHVLSAIIKRIRDGREEQVPLTQRWDTLRTRRSVIAAAAPIRPQGRFRAKTHER